MIGAEMRDEKAFTLQQREHDVQLTPTTRSFVRTSPYDVLLIQALSAQRRSVFVFSVDSIITPPGCPRTSTPISQRRSRRMKAQGRRGMDSRRSQQSIL